MNYFTIKYVFGIALVALLVSGCTTTAPANGATNGLPAGTSNPGTTGTTAATSSNGVAQDLSQLTQAPSDYCITYLSSINTAAYGGQETPYTTIEYCQKNNDIFEALSFGAGSTGIADQAMTKFYCLENGTKKIVCSASICYTDESACDQQRPFAETTGVVEADLVYYKRGPDRSLGGVSAKCYYMNINDLQPGAYPAGADRVEYCYHPQFNQLLYVESMGVKVQVTNYTTPAPASKFIAPAITNSGYQ